MVYFICEWYKITNIVAIDLPSLVIDEREQQEQHKKKHSGSSHIRLAYSSEYLFWCRKYCVDINGVGVGGGGWGALLILALVQRYKYIHTVYT